MPKKEFRDLVIEKCTKTVAKHVGVVHVVAESNVKASSMFLDFELSENADLQALRCLKEAHPGRIKIMQPKKGWTGAGLKEPFPKEMEDILRWIDAMPDSIVMNLSSLADAVCDACGVTPQEEE
jgi:hypothetical protein